MPFLGFYSLLGSLDAQAPLKVGVAGLTHTHVHWIFNSESEGHIDIVGIAEPNQELAQRYVEQYGLSMDMVYPTLQELLEAKDVEAVTAFGSIFEHLEVVQICAPLGVHVMVEKPLAVSREHAEEMARLARTHKIQLLTNYETTWYPTNHLAYQKVIEEGEIGDIRKIIVRDGHRGPKKIGIDQEFLDWLTDPKLNGGGAVIDFGCYGANLITWLMKGQKPKSVFAMLGQFQAENNPKVDDEATILLDYGSAQGIIQASWNWPIGRKDLEIYGLTGAVYADNKHEFRLRMAEGYDDYVESYQKLPVRPSPQHDPFAYLAAVVRGDLVVSADDLSSLENNLVVVEILEAAIRSAEEGKAIKLDP